MKTYKNIDLERYLRDDWILAMMQRNMEETERQIRTYRWLEEMDNKRLIYSDVYGDILHEKSSLKVLDVGGGYNALTKVLAQNSNYVLLDFAAHGDGLLKLAAEKYHINWLNMDWYNYKEPEDYDIVIANDIFPDVDQRLELFIEKMLPHCTELRLVVTYYNNPRFYTTKRIDDSEILTFLSWDGEIAAMKLRKYLSRSNASIDELDAMKDHKESIYWNGRQVSYIIIKGDLNNGL